MLARVLLVVVMAAVASAFGPIRSASRSSTQLSMKNEASKVAVAGE